MNDAIPMIFAPCCLLILSKWRCQHKLMRLVPRLINSCRPLALVGKRLKCKLLLITMESQSC